MGEQLAVCGKTYRILKLLGHGKGGYSYLAEDGGQQVVAVNGHVLHGDDDVTGPQACLLGGGPFHDVDDDGPLDTRLDKGRRFRKLGHGHR